MDENLNILQVFSAFGLVQKIAIFEKNGSTQALIQYPGMFSPAFSGNYDLNFTMKLVMFLSVC